MLVLGGPVVRKEREEGGSVKEGKEGEKRAVM
jgi:hypothetical protein